MQAVVRAGRFTGLLPPFDATLEAVNCHHNYVAREHHYGENVLVTRKGGEVRALRRDERHEPLQPAPRYFTPSARRTSGPDMLEA
jgi:tRNA-splicing ligase RtcB